VLFMKPSEALDAHRAELRELVSRHGLLGARVFRSVLTGTDDEASDLDLLVDPTKTTTLFTLAGSKADAEELLGVPVSVLTPDALPPRFHSQVLRQAQHPERVEDYLGHIAEAIARATSYVEPLQGIEASGRTR
jgi:hypothetical protein